MTHRSYDERYSDAMARLTPEAEAAILAAHAPGAGIGLDAQPWADGYLPTSKKLSKEPAKRRAVLETDVATCLKDIDRDIDIYETYRVGGAKECSKYDVMIAYGENAGAALKGALYLTGNHIVYGRMRLAALRREMGLSSPAPDIKTAPQRLVADMVQLSLF